MRDARHFAGRSATGATFGCHNSVVGLLALRAALGRFMSLALLAFAVSGIVFGADLSRTVDYDYDAPAPGSYALPVIKAAADGDALDCRGRQLRLRDVTHGRVTVMSFIYTRCAAAKACPYATGVLRELHQISSEEPALAKGMRLVSMSFDPGVDTPDRMADYATLAGKYASAAEWQFLTTRSRVELQPILDAYGQAVDRKSNPLDPTGPLNHTLRVFLIDPDGNIRNIYSSDTLDPRLVLADVRTLLMEAKHSNAEGLSSKTR